MRSKFPISKIAISLAVVLCAAWPTACGGDGDASPGCDRKKKKIELQGVSWTDTGGEENRLTTEEFRKAAKAALGLLPNPTSAPGKISVEGLLEQKGDEMALVLEARIDLENLPVPIETGVAGTSAAVDGAAASALVKKGLDDLAHAATNLLNLAGADDAGLVRALRSAEPDEQILALKLLGIRKASKSIEAIGEILTDPRTQVAEAAAETLGEIGDERAVPLLIKSIRRDDLRSEVRAIEIMGKIGGREAEAYLDMTANGHEVAEVRALSESLLQKLREDNN